MPRYFSKIFIALALFFILSATRPVLSQPNKTVAPAAVASAPSEQELNDTREQLLSLLKMSPLLTEVVETDPALLADQEYVAHSNPQLAQFLAQHPEVTRNPDFYLFANFPEQRGRHIGSLRRRVNNNSNPQYDEAESRRRFLLNLLQIPMFLAVLGILVWLIRIVIENRRWSRVFRMQNEVHGKLLDRFASSQELLHYMETEPGKRFLEAAPIPIEFERDQRLPGGLARVLAPLQIGVVLTLLGLGMLVLHNSSSLQEIASALLVFGMATMMPGIGFIISALISWRISARLGLLPQAAAPSLGSADRQ